MAASASVPARRELTDLMEGMILEAILGDDTLFLLSNHGDRGVL